MNIDSNEIRQALLNIKDQMLKALDKAKQNKVRNIITANIGVIEQFLIWLSNTEKTGAINMSELKLGQLTKWEPKPRKGSIDEMIIQDAKALKKNFDAIKVTVEDVKWTTFQNRTYQLNKDEKISPHVFPRRDENGAMHLVWFDEIPKRRRKRDE